MRQALSAPRGGGFGIGGREMNERDAREMLLPDRIRNLTVHEIGIAMGYLEALAKAKVLEEALEAIAADCTPYEGCTCETAIKALDEWRKSK